MKNMNPLYSYKNQASIKENNNNNKNIQVCAVFVQHGQVIHYTWVRHSVEVQYMSKVLHSSNTIYTLIIVWYKLYF